MSLFNNKNEILCNQLFIDEGFVNFDKYNLSIVPQFLKSLLLYFNNVIIVSHLDIIQDNIDEIAEINFNKSTGVSFMTYNNQIKISLFFSLIFIISLMFNMHISYSSLLFNNCLSAFLYAIFIICFILSSF